MDYVFSMEDKSIDIYVPSKDDEGNPVYDKYWVSLGEFSNYLVR